MAKITINGVSLDPVQQASLLSRLALASRDSSASNYILVQTAGSLTKQQRTQLAAAGAEALEYVPEETYLCHFAASDLAALRALPFVTWVNVYLQGFKIAPRLRQPAAHASSADLLRLRPGALGTPAQQPQLVDVVLHRNVSGDAVRAQLAEAAGLDAEAMVPCAGKLRVRVQPKRLAALSAIDAVRHIEPVFERQLFNNVALSVLAADVVHKHMELQGEGEVVAVCDTGFDLGSLKNVHPAFKNRVLKLYALGRETATDPDGHGTHVCGSLLGDGASTTLGTIRGAAPKAKLVMQSVLDAHGGLGGLPSDLAQVFDTPYSDDGARVHSNSWGEAASGAYTTSAHELDDYVWNHRDMVVVFAAGNEGADRHGNGVIDAGSIGSPGTAKNCITVGACENDRPDFVYAHAGAKIRTYGEGWPDQFPAEPIASDALADSADGLAAFSSRGPTKDGRIKPDVVAPGTGILSTRSRAKGVSSGWGASSDPLYFYEGGTSMATPLVAGCAAVIRQYFRQARGAQPSAALVKATLINGATSLTGPYHPTESGALPNIAEGFGRVNLFDALAPPTDGSLFTYWDEGEPLDSREERSIPLVLPRMATTLKATLVWTDPPGEALQNDLDLIVKTACGIERHGNMRGGASGFDRRNNVEQVSLSHVAAGDVTIIVRAHRVALCPQSFALVVRAT